MSKRFARLSMLWWVLTWAAYLLLDSLSIVMSDRWEVFFWGMVIISALPATAGWILSDELDKVMSVLSLIVVFVACFVVIGFCTFILTELSMVQIAKKVSVELSMFTTPIFLFAHWLSKQ